MRKIAIFISVHQTRLIFSKGTHKHLLSKNWHKLLMSVSHCSQSCTLLFDILQYSWTQRQSQSLCKASDHSLIGVEHLVEIMNMTSEHSQLGWHQLIHHLGWRHRSTRPRRPLCLENHRTRSVLLLINADVSYDVRLVRKYVTTGTRPFELCSAFSWITKRVSLSLWLSETHCTP